MASAIHLVTQRRVLMRRELIRLGTTASAAVLVTLGLGFTSAAAVTVPAAPTGDELHANSNSSITLTWPASAGATSYHIYRGTTAGGEGNTPIASTTGTTYTDLNL